MERKDFNNWLFLTDRKTGIRDKDGFGNPPWKEIAYEYNTGRQFQHKQDLIAVFWNSYIYIEQKFEIYYKEFGIIPEDIFNKLIFRFRQFFPINGRVDGVSYFDDLLLQLIEQYKPKKGYRGTVLKSFAWNGSQAQKETLSEALEDAGYIEAVSINDFTAIFADEIPEGEPIPWKGTNRLLSYLFNQMNSGNKPLILSSEWQSVIEKYRLFKNRNGKLLIAGDLSTALSNINDAKIGFEVKGSGKIDEILKNIKTLIP